MKLIILASISLLLFNIGFSQKKSVRKIDSLSYINKIDSLKKEFKNVSSIKKHELQIFIAISYYPELKDIKINFEEDNISTMNCKPKAFSLFTKNHVYTIKIRNKSKFEGIFFEDIFFNAQIGIIAHELAHITDYEKGIFHVIGRGIDYSSKKSKEKFEKEIDKLTIEHKLGWQLYDWSYFAIYESKATEEYKNFKKKIYLEPSEIEKIIKEQ